MDTAHLTKVEEDSNGRQLDGGEVDCKRSRELSQHMIRLLPEVAADQQHHEGET